MAARRHAELWVYVGVPALAFAVAPGLDAPFSSPKRWVLGALALGAAGLALAGPRRTLPAWTWAPAVALALLAALSALHGTLATPEALGTLFAACVLFLAAAHLEIRPRALVEALAWSGAGLSLVAVAQALGLDPFRALGLDPVLVGERMRVYGTLGNPDFLAALLVPAACATAALLGRESAHRIFWGGVLALEVLSVALTRSFGTVLALCAALAVVSSVGRGRRRAWGVGLCAAALALATVGVRGRSLSTSARGRLYLLEVAAPHLLDAPLLGQGPGSVAALWPSWEAGYWQRHGAERERPFVALQRHAHDDLLEAGLSLGLPGLLALLAWIAFALRAGLGRRTDPDALALTCALAALAARALVDFPLQRPAALGLFALLTATLSSPPLFEVSSQEPSCPESSVPSPQRSA
jgi:O-antigen ligase